MLDATFWSFGFCVVLAIVLFVIYVCKRVYFWVAVRWLPGPPALPVLGNALLLTGGQDKFFQLLTQCAEKYGDVFRLWVGQRPFVFLYRAEAVQPILNSSLHINKSYEYSFLLPWLGTGLLTATGEKWHSRRKLLTPSFHSHILEDFLEPIYQESLLLCRRLQMELDKPYFNIMPYVKLCALDVICNTALGTKMNAQNDSNSEYVIAVDRLSEILQRRFITPWLKPDSIFKRSEFGKRQAQCLKIIHEFTGKVINEHKQERKQQENCVSENSQSAEIKKKRRLALLDLLLEFSQDGSVLSASDIQEEVSTFTFAGHDTIAAGVGWCLYVLGHHLDAQEKVVQEVRNVKEAGGGEWPTIKQLQKLIFLERCIKEAMRLYPVVPLIARDIKQPVQIFDHVLPPGVTVLVNTYILHRDPRFFPNPDIFDPDRFLLENCETRHPFAYIPFSAGPRNCIGHRFATLELKVILSTILCQYMVKSVDTERQLNLMGELVLLNKEVPFDEDDKDKSVWFLDHDYLENMYGMFKKVNAREKIVGWYHTGPKLHQNDVAINELIRRYCPNSVLVIIDAKPKDLGLPTEAYKAVEEVHDDGSPTSKTFEHVPSEIGAEEAEEVGVEHLLRDIKDTTVGTLSQRITNQLLGLKGLHLQIRDIRNYLVQVVQGKLPINHQIVYQLQDIFNLLPDISHGNFVESLYVKTNDQMLVVYLAALIRSIIALHNLINNKLTNRDAEKKEGKKDEVKDSKEKKEEKTKEEIKVEKK